MRTSPRRSRPWTLSSSAPKKGKSPRPLPARSWTIIRAGSTAYRREACFKKLLKTTRQRMFDQDHEIKIGEAIINQFNVMYERLRTKPRAINPGFDGVVDPVLHCDNM